VTGVATGDATATTVAQVVSEGARALLPQLTRETTPREHLRADDASPSSLQSLEDPEGRDSRRSPESLEDLARREAREIVAAVMRQPRFWPSIAGDTPLGADARATIESAIARRARGAPLAYAVRSAPFRHLTLYVDERVLIPRPETEYLVDRIMAFGADRLRGVAVDVGTGSGAIALALAAEGHFSRVVATDVSHDALAVARRNAEECAASLRAPVELREGDALAPLDDLAGSVELLVSNPPYIAFDELAALPRGVRDWEPALALSCADDGMAVTRAIVNDAGRLLRPGGILAFEVDVRRARRVAHLVREAGTYEGVEVLLDLTGRERYVLARRRGTN